MSLNQCEKIYIKQRPLKTLTALYFFQEMPRMHSRSGQRVSSYLISRLFVALKLPLSGQQKAKTLS